MYPSKQRGVSLGAALLILICLFAILGTIQATWGPVYEEQCTEPTPEELASAKKFNDVFTSPIAGDYKPEAKCKKVLVR